MLKRLPGREGCFRMRGMLERGGMHVLLAAVLAGASGCRAQQPWPLWDSYAKKFLDGQGRVIDHSAGDRTTTEGEAYAMFFALVSNDRVRFKSLVDWSEANLANGDLTQRLPAWSWGKAADGSWHVLDAHAASDADLWMAYTLCEAGRLWRDDRYAKLGSILADRIALEEVALVPSVGPTLLPGPAGFHLGTDTYLVNPSYLQPSILAYFAHIKPQGPWRSMEESLPAVAQGNAGWAMDWVAATSDGVQAAGTPAELASGKPGAVPVGSYDAIRLYLWLGMAHPHTPGVHDTLHELTAMASYLQTHPIPPAKVDSTGKVLDAGSPPGFSAAAIPYLKALGLPAQGQSDRLAATTDVASGLYGHGGDYYDQNLALFSTGWTEGRFGFESDGKLHVRWR